MVIAQDPKIDLAQFVEGLNEPPIISHPGSRVGPCGLREQDGWSASGSDSGAIDTDRGHAEPGFSCPGNGNAGFHNG